jgi:hypothetical protein
VLNASVSQLHGTGRLSGVRIVSTGPQANLMQTALAGLPECSVVNQTPADSTSPGTSPLPGFLAIDLWCDTLVTSIGMIPELELLNQLGLSGEQDKTSPAAGANHQTGLPWLFLAGNAREVQAFVDNVVDDGNHAGAAAARYLKHG